MTTTDTDAALYIALLGLIYAPCTYIAAQHSLAGGALFGGLGCLIVLVVGKMART
jgi:hypothetical protein